MRCTLFTIAQLLDRIAIILPLTIYLFGIGALVVKVAFPGLVGMSEIALGCAGVFFISLLIDSIKRWRDQPSPAYALAWLELRNHAGGRIIAEEPEAMDSIRVRPGITPVPVMKSLLLPVLFAAAALYISPSQAPTGPSGAGVKKSIALLEEKLDTAAAANALPVIDVEELREQLRQLENAAEKSPEAAAEALAAMEGKLDDAAFRRLDRGEEAMDKASRALDALAASDVDNGSINSSQEAEWEKSLSAMLDAVDELSKGEGGFDKLPSELQSSLEEAMRDAGAKSLGELKQSSGLKNTMSRERLERIQKALRECNAANASAAMASGLASEKAESLANAVAAGMDGQGAGEREGKTDAGGMVPALSESMSGMLVVDGEPGRGGVNRGRGDAPLVFGRESDEANARFEYKPLEASGNASPGDMLARERARPDKPMPPGEFMPIGRSGANVSGRVQAGESGVTMGPERALAAQRYFQSLSK